MKEPEQPPWQEHLSRWRRALTLEQLADEALTLAMRLVDRAIARASAAHIASAEVLRAALHVRPQDAYRAVLTCQRVAEDEQRLLSSATLWPWVQSRDEPLGLDTTLGVLSPISNPQHEAIALDDPGEGRLSSRSSLILLLERDATHILLLPLHDLYGEVMGMLCVEARCEGAIGTRFVWPECCEALTHLTDLLSPFLVDRLGHAPPQQAPEAEVAPLRDQHLPVVGAALGGRLKILAAFAAQEETLLLSGETGVGKSRLAAWCHAHSARAKGPLEVLDLSSIPEAMQVAHLVGWKRGAFTGADREVVGALSRAQGGTLFIDEIDKLSLETQASLLSLLETYRYQMLGEGKGSEEADVRFIVGTNLDLRQQVLQGSFRADLYYRICVLPLHVPPLRERLDELPGWAEYMLRRALGGVGSAPISSAALSLLAAQRWPGNLRQLDNVMRRAAALARASDGEAMLPLRVERVRQALAMEQQGEGGSAPREATPHAATARSASETIQEAARAYLAATRAALEAGDEPLSLDLLDGIKGAALALAMETARDTEEALGWVGKAHLLKNRNHHKALAREEERLQALLEALARHG